MPQSYHDVLAAFMAEHNRTPASLSDGNTRVQFWMNPNQWTNDGEFLYAEAPTIGGYCRWDFGTRPNTVTIDGHTGNAGRTGPGGLYDLEKFRPQLGRKNKLLMLQYPSRFDGVRYVRINKFSDQLSLDLHLYSQYRIEFTELGPSSVNPYVRLSSSPLTVSLPVGG